MSRGADTVVFEHDRDQVTIGDLREWHYLEVTCSNCGRVGRVYPAALRKRSAESALIAELAKRFTCSRCWTRGGQRWNVLKIARDE